MGSSLNAHARDHSLRGPTRLPARRFLLLRCLRQKAADPNPAPAATNSFVSLPKTLWPVPR